MNETPLNPNNPNTTPKSNYSILDLGRNLIRTSYKKVEEKNLIILGDKATGKTTLFNTILQSSSHKDSYTPTCGVNYSYMRYQPSTSKKFVLNIYEIGGGIKNVSLLKAILSQINIQNTIFLLVVDFSQPENILKSLKFYIKEINSMIRELFDQELISDMIESKRFKYSDRNSNDFKRINFHPAEIILLGNKYDYLEKIDAEKIRWTCRTLRYFCHLNSLSLVYFKINEPKLAKILSSLITTLSFHANELGASNTILHFSQKNDLLPLFVLYSGDSLEEIGDPKVIMQGRDMSSMWEDTFYSIFGNNNCGNGNNYDNGGIMKDYSEDVKDFKEIEALENELKMKYREPRIDEEVQIFERRMENPLINKGNVSGKKVKSKKKVEENK